MSNASPEKTDEQGGLILPKGIQNPVAVYTAKERLEAETLCDILRDADIVVLDRAAAFRQIQAYSGTDARFGVELIVDASQAEQAKALIQDAEEALSHPGVDEEELSRLAEETPLPPPKDNLSFRLLPVILAIIAAALAILYMIR